LATLLVKDIHTLVTMDAERREIHDAAIFSRDGVVEFVGETSAIPETYLQADELITLKNHIVMPGLVNTHHHMTQCLTRVIAQDKELFDWLVTLYPIWQGITGQMAYIAARTAMAELILSGCTSSSDHLYLYPNDVALDDAPHRKLGCAFIRHAAL